ncbi:MAG: hypothetical protein OCC45_06605 [Desulfotalea sp.]
MGFFSNLFSFTGQQESSGSLDKMKYCPQCGDEYRPDFSTCAHCNVELVGAGYRRADERNKQALLKHRSMKISKNDRMETIQRGPMKEMKHLATVLARHHIPANLESDPASMRGG